MYVAMITGGLGSGKSKLRETFCQHGATDIDLDAISRTLLLNNDQMAAELVEEFGPDILDEDGIIVPAALASRAFASEEATQAMNAITFPYITEHASEYILNIHCSRRTDAEVMVVEVPLLDQVPEFAKLADEVIAICAPGDLRLKRAIERGMDPADALRRINLQATDSQRREQADVVYENTGTLEEMDAWVIAWFDSHGFACDTEAACNG